MLLLLLLMARRRHDDRHRRALDWQCDDGADSGAHHEPRDRHHTLVDDSKERLHLGVAVVATAGVLHPVRHLLFWGFRR